MREETRLSTDSLYRPCRPSDVPFETTADASAVTETGVGQNRAVEALRFGVGVQQAGYNLFAVGPPGVGKRTLLRMFLDEHAGQRETPSDWCYVHNFASPGTPRALEMPPGVGIELQRGMAHMVDDLRTAMRSAFESEDYRTRKQDIVNEFEQRQQRAFADIQARAKQHDVALLNTDAGVVIAPIHGGEILEADQFHALPTDQREKFHGEMERVREEVQELHRKVHAWAREQEGLLTDLDREVATGVARDALAPLRKQMADLPEVIDYLGQVEANVVESADQFLESSAQGMEAMLRQALRGRADGATFRRYEVNVLVDRTGLQGAPVVTEVNPTHPNLIGRIEHESQFGSLVTNFMLIKGGAFHRAAGGYLVLDALKVLQHPYAWEAVKRTIRSGEIKIESLGQSVGLVPTVSLEPDPMPLGDTKVVLMGDRHLYYLLAVMDPDFPDLFKVVVDFDEDLERQPESQAMFANLVAMLVQTESLRPFDRSAVARIIDHAVRMAGDAEKLSIHMGTLANLLRETDYWAQQAGRDVASAADVQKAIDAQRMRTGRIPDRLQEAIQREDIVVVTHGERVGQINGLSVFLLGERAVGHPTRITARTRLGKGEVVDIEREVELGGPIHSKGVLILGGFLGARYAGSTPLSLSATLVFEQTYGTVEGDSASLAELCVLLSSIAEVPLKQSFAVTGSVDQDGRVQSVGGVNEKIEGFFDVCERRGLTGEEGVLIPRSNVKNLVLRADVLEALDAGRFQIHAVEHVDDALELLTGMPAGRRDASGAFPEGTVNAAVETRLHDLAERARNFASKPAAGD